MIDRVYYRVKLDANTFIYTPYLSNIPTSIIDIPTNVTYDTTDGITLKTIGKWTYDNNESSLVTTERVIPLKAGEGVTMDVSEDGKYVVIKVDPKRETHIGTSVPTDDYPDLFVNTADDSLSYKAPDGSWKPIAGGGSGGGLVDDVRVNGRSVVENKVANLVVDTELNEQSLNPIANSLFAPRITAIGGALSGHITNKTNPHDVTAAQIGLGNVDNTSDADKPVSSKQAVAINAVEDQIILHKDNKSNPHAVTAAQVGLGNVNNTSDTNKPISNAQQDALDKKLDLSGGTLTGPLNIQGDLNIYGTASAEKQQSVEVKDTMIVTNIDGIDIKVVLSGLAMKMNDKDVYGIVYDPATNTVKLGLGTYVNKKFLFNSGEGLPLAIRADSSQFTAGHLVKWDATKNRLVDAGKSISEVGKTPKSIDAVNGAFTSVTYDTTDGITLVSITKIINTDDSEYTATLSQEIPLVAGAGISMDVMAGQQQVEIKIDQSKNFTIYGNTSRYFTADTSTSFGMTEGSLYTSYGDENGTPTIVHKDPSGIYKYNFPINVAGTHTLLSNNNVKTLFGKSIVGEDNIDLYLHNICFTSTDPDKIVKIRFIVPSFNNFKVNSLAVLKSLLGNTFTYPVNGANSTSNQSIYEITETGFKSGETPYVLYDTVTPYPAGTWTDDVKTV